MKLVTKDEWDRTPDEYKKIYDGTFYMIYKETDGRVCFGPVKLKEDNMMRDLRRLYPHMQ